MFNAARHGTVMYSDNDVMLISKFYNICIPLPMMTTHEVRASEGGSGHTITLHPGAT